MPEYIKREDVIDLITRRYENPEICTKEINSIPAADVAPVRNAKVIDKIYDDHETIKPWDYRYYCSACKIAIRDSWIKYCPNCGAKMDGGAD